MFWRKILFCITSLALFTVIAFGQNATDPKKSDEIPAEIKEKAVNLIKKMARDAATLNLPENRLTFTIAAAAMLWQHDEQTAREIFRNSMNDVRGMILEHQQRMAARIAEADDKTGFLELESGDSTYADTSQLSSLREQLILTYGKFDGDAAQRFMLETRPVFPPSSDGKKNSNDFEAMSRGTFTTEEKEARLEISLANVIAKNDPQKAYDIAAKSLAKGISPNINTLLGKLYAKDKERGARLAEEFLRKLKTAKLDFDYGARHEAFDLFRQALKSIDETAKSTAADKKPLLAESGMRELAEIIAKSGLALKSNDKYQYYEYNEVLDSLNKYAPATTAQLKQKMNAPNLVTSTGSNVTFETKNIISNSNSGEQGRDARNEFNELIKNAGSPDKKLTIEEIRQTTGKIKNKNARLTALTQAAIMLAERGDKDLAKEVLADARKMTPAQPKFMMHFFEHLLIARAFASVDPEQSFDMLESMILQLDDLIGAFIKVGEFVTGNMIIKDGEVRLSGLPMFVGMGLGRLGGNEMESFGAFDKDILKLAKADFDRTAALTEKFSRTEARLLARMIVINSIFPEKPDDLIMPSGMEYTVEERVSSDADSTEPQR